MGTGLELILIERVRQMEVELWTPEHDDLHQRGELKWAAECYFMPACFRTDRFLEHRWPWLKRWWKPTPNNRRRELVKDGALFLAEASRQGRLGHRATQLKMLARAFSCAKKINRLNKIKLTLENYGKTK